MPVVFANVLQPLIDAFDAVLQFFHDSLGFSWGWSIVALTLCVRALILPLTLRQMRSMQRLAHLQPQLKAIQEKYKDDPQRKNQEVMRFYQEHQVNPLASCLPLAAQIPVFISLFYMLRKDLRHDICPAITAHAPNPVPCNHAHGGAPAAAHFLGIPDITDKATGVVLAVLIVLYVSSQLLSSFLSMQTADRTQRILFLALPFVFVGFVVRFPAGLLVYWITTNLWTIVQGYVVRRQVGPIRPPTPDAKGAGAGDGPGGSGAGAPAARGGGLFGGLMQRAPAAGDTARDGGTGNGGAREAPAAAATRRASAPPPSPRKKKKRSGRRR